MMSGKPKTERPQPLVVLLEMFELLYDLRHNPAIQLPDHAEGVVGLCLGMARDTLAKTSQAPYLAARPIRSHALMRCGSPDAPVFEVDPPAQVSAPRRTRGSGS